MRRELGPRKPRCAIQRRPPHVLRWLTDDRVLFAGGRAAARSASRSADKALVQRTGQLMYELSTLYPADLRRSRRVGVGRPGFDETVDGLPYHRAASQLSRGNSLRSAHGTSRRRRGLACRPRAAAAVPG